MLLFPHISNIYLGLLVPTFVKSNPKRLVAGPKAHLWCQPPVGYFCTAEITCQKKGIFLILYIYISYILREGWWEDYPIDDKLMTKLITCKLGLNPSAQREVGHWHSIM